MFSGRNATNSPEIKASKPGRPKPSMRLPSFTLSKQPKISSPPLSSENKPLPPLTPEMMAADRTEYATWDDYNRAYAQGEIDFDNPPPPPSKLATSGKTTSSGQYWAPTPVNEKRRQRAVDNLGLGLAIQIKPKSAKHSRNAAPRPLSGDSVASSSSSSSRESAASYSSGDSSVEADFDEIDAEFEEILRPKDLDTFPVLQDLAVSASKEFGTGVCSVSLMDRDKQVFLAEVGLNTDYLPRESTVCSHTLLKATTNQPEGEPLVVLDLAKDWRFEQNNFGDYSKGFYAALPIMVPAPFGDKSQKVIPQASSAFYTRAVDDKPRGSFTDEERARLAKMADEAGQEIARSTAKQEEKKAEKLVIKFDEWKRRNKVVKKVAVKSSLESVTEVLTPPASPVEGEVEAFEPGTPRRPSLARTFTSESSTSAIITTDLTPTFQGGKLGQIGVHASGPPRMSPEIRSMLDLSTRLIGESLDLDFTYLVQIDLPSSPLINRKPEQITSKQVKLLASHNVPIPSPLFDISLHMETLQSSQNALLYQNHDHSGQDGEYGTGLLVKCLVADGRGFVLGGFSESATRVLNRQDFLFFRSFASDIAKYLADL